MVSIPPKIVREPHSFSDEERAEHDKTVKHSEISSSSQISDTDRSEKKRQFPKGISSNLAKKFAAKKQRIEETLRAPDFLATDRKATVIISADTSKVSMGSRDKLLASVFKTDSVDQSSEELKIGSDKQPALGLKQKRTDFLSLSRNQIDYSKADSD